MFQSQVPRIVRAHYPGLQSSLSDRLDIEVEQSTWQVFEAPTVASTGCVWPCVAIVIHSPQKRIASIAHLDFWDDLRAPKPDGELAQFLKFSADHIGDLGSALVYTGGGAHVPLFDPDPPVNTKAITGSLINSGISERNLFERWAVGNSSHEIIIDLSNGNVELLESLS